MKSNLSARAARGLSTLVDAARVFAAKSDEEWAGEVAALKEELIWIAGMVQHQRDCTSPVGQPDECSCGVGKILARIRVAADVE